MTNKAFNDLRLGFDTTYTYNEYFKKYVDTNCQGHKNMYGSIDFSTEDMKTARKFWKQNAKNIQIIRGLCRRKLRIGLIKCHLAVMSISMQYRKAEYTKSLPFIVHISTRMEVR